MLIKKIKIALGIITKRILTGPIEVSVDLTRKCTGGCLICWYWSPLLKEPASFEWANQVLDFNLIDKLVKDFCRLDVKKIILGGQGEPLLYPKILETIRIIKKNKIQVSLITSGLNLNEEKVRVLFDLGVDNIDISLQAATADTYLKVHPLQEKDAFNKIKNSLLFLLKLKKQYKRKIPLVQIIHVICNLNYKETTKMIELAKELGAYSVGFKRIDVIPDTKELLLNNEQLEELRNILFETEIVAKRLKIRTGIDDYRKYTLEGLTSGFYTADFYSHIPCYVGWRSSRILSNGDIVPCCGCDSILGNIYKSSFIDIWHSKQYKQFRIKALNITKDRSFLDKCKYYSCIDYKSNLGVYRKLYFFKKI